MFNYVGKNPFMDTIHNIPEEMKHFNYWGYSRIPYEEIIDGKKTINKGKAPCNKNGDLRSYKSTRHLKTFKFVTENNPLFLYYSFALMNKYICFDIDGCFKEDGTLYKWAKDIINKFDKKGFYIEYSLSGNGLHVFARSTLEILDLIKELFNSTRKQIQINKTFSEYKNLPDKCKIEVFTDFIIIITGKIYNNNNPQFINEADINFKNMLYNIKKIDDNNWHEKTSSIDEVIKENNDIKDVFNYIKYFVSIKQVLSYYNIKINNKNINCPLYGHQDKDPSFTVNYTFNLWYCHACKVGGSVIDLVMKLENLSNPLDAAKKINEMFMLDIKFTKSLEAKSKIEYAKKITKDKVISQLAKFEGSSNFVEDEEKIEEIPWILTEINEKTGELRYRILPSILAEHIRNKKEYIFVKSYTSTPLKYIYLGGVYILADDFIFASMIKKYIPIQLQKSKDIREVLYLLTTDNCYITYDMLNPENYINFKNGLLNIKTWQLEKHTKEVLSTIQIPCNYIKDMENKNSVFDKYMRHLSDDNADIEKLLRQFMAATISNIPGYKMKKALFMVGPHDVGKTQLKKLLASLVGEENSSPVDLKQLESRFGGYQVYGKRLVGSNDMSYMSIEELKFFKMLTGGDPVFIESKGKDGFNTIFNGILWFCCNQLPLFKGDRGDGVYNRIIVTTCKNIVHNKDKFILEKMLAEREYIISSLIVNLKQIIENDYNYNVPRECEFNIEEYKTENNSFLDFLQNCCVSYSDANEDFTEINRADFYRYYYLWNKENYTSKAERKKEVFDILKDKGLHETKTVNGHIKYKFISIAKEILREYQGLFEKFYPKATTYI